MILNARRRRSPILALASTLLLLAIFGMRAPAAAEERRVAAGVTVSAAVREVQWLNDRDVVAVRFDITVNNRSRGDVIMTPGRIITRYDGENSRETLPVTVAGQGNAADPVRLPPGRTTYRLYSLFSESVSLAAESSFEILEAGIEVRDMRADQPVRRGSLRWASWTARRDISATIGGEPAPVFQDPAFPEDFVIYDRDIRGRRDSQCWIFNLAWQDVRAAGCNGFRVRAGSIALKPEAMPGAEAPVPGKGWRDAMADCRVSPPAAGQEPRFGSGAILFGSCGEWVKVRFSRQR